MRKRSRQAKAPLSLMPSTLAELGLPERSSTFHAQPPRGAGRASPATPGRRVTKCQLSGEEQIAKSARTLRSAALPQTNEKLPRISPGSGIEVPQ
jgi:hypothetical protein